MSLIPVTIFGSAFTSAEVTFLTGLADHTYTDGQLIIGNGSTGGVSISTLTAGTNITITNGHGTITIAASGGSGFSTLSATQTPNGVITVFTFSGASAQPSYLVVDGLWKLPTNKDSTVNWTWNSGTKQATLSVPAQDDIFGVV